MGFDVQLSETNDFDVDTNKNSYEACLDTIERCDFFILLIGSRVGGLYNKEKQISITMAEYNKAYDLLCKGKIKKIINFVRKELFDIKDDRKSLENYLKEIFGVNDDKKVLEDYSREYKSKRNELIKDITYHSSKFMNNAEFIINFINHVGKNNQMKASLDNNKPLPNANWIFQFTNYEDIIDVLKVQLNAKSDINSKIHCEKIRYEVEKILLNFCFDKGSNDGSVRFPYMNLISMMNKMPSVREKCITLTYTRH